MALPPALFRLFSNVLSVRSQPVALTSGQISLRDTVERDCAIGLPPFALAVKAALARALQDLSALRLHVVNAKRRGVRNGVPLWL